MFDVGGAGSLINGAGFAGLAGSNLQGLGGLNMLQNQALGGNFSGFPSGAANQLQLLNAAGFGADPMAQAAAAGFKMPVSPNADPLSGLRAGAGSAVAPFLAQARATRSSDSRSSSAYASRHQAAEQRRRTRINERQVHQQGVTC